MKRVESPTSPTGDELDALLGAFFKAEMPDPWPAFQPPQQAPRTLPFRRPQPHSRRWSPLASRAALAASVILLLLGSWLLPGSAPRDDRSTTIPTIGEGIADPRISPIPRRPGKVMPEKKLKSSLHLEQGNDGRTGVKITVEELPSNK